MTHFWLFGEKNREKICLCGKISKRRLLQWHLNISWRRLERRWIPPIGEQITPSTINKKGAWAGRAGWGGAFSGSLRLVSPARLLSPHWRRWSVSGCERRAEERGRERGKRRWKSAQGWVEQGNRTPARFTFLSLGPEPNRKGALWDMMRFISGRQ